MKCLGIFSPSKSSRGFVFKSVLVLCYQKPGTEVYQARKISPILCGVRFNLAMEKSDGDGALESRAIEVVRDVFTRTGFSFWPLKLRHTSGAVKHLCKARQGDVLLKSVRCLTTRLWALFLYNCMGAAGCQLLCYTSLLFLNKKLLKS